MAKKEVSKEEVSTIRAKLEDAKQKIADLEESFETKVSEKPLQSVGIAFGAGVVAGALIYALLRRR